jgi:PleD family two-component response regulator
VQVQPDEDPRAAIARADARLYEAKGHGRNQVKSEPDQE